jgi:hypothetical protein
LLSMTIITTNPKARLLARLVARVGVWSLATWTAPPFMEWPAPLL